MKSRVSSLLKLAGFIAGTLVFVLYTFKYNRALNSFVEYIDLFSEAVGYTVALIIFYERFLWKYNPLIKVPRLKKTYEGTLRFCYSGYFDEKNVSLEIYQTYLTVFVKMTTNEIVSNTITSELLEEGNEYVLYYTYQTNPKSEFSDDNPIQLGTCKLFVKSPDKLVGSYWTNRKTIGDLELI